MPSLSDQLSAALSTPVPFFLAVLGVAVVIWRAMEWAYRKRIDLLKTMHEQVANENRIVKNRLADTKADLDAAKKVETKLGEIAKDSPDLENVLSDLTVKTTSASSHLVQAEQANTALSQILNRARITAPSNANFSSIYGMDLPQQPLVIRLLSGGEEPTPAQKEEGTKK
jgi:hypothetical protein